MIFRRKTAEQRLQAAVRTLTGRKPGSPPSLHLREILLAADGSPSPSAAAARDWAFRLARDEAALHVLSVGTGEGEATRLFTGGVRDAQAAVRQVVDEAARRGVALRTASTVLGDPATEIAKAVQRHGVDLLVLGNGGQSRLAFEGLGSTGRKVRDAVPCSVLVARPPRHDGRIVCGVDGSSQSLQAALLAYALAGRLGWSLRVVHSSEAPAQPVLPRRGDTPSWSQPGPPVEFGKTTEGAVNALLEESRHAALLVVGAKGLTGAPGWGLGGVSDRVSSKADCSVLVVKAPR